MSPTASKQDLLYVAGAEVYVYTYPQGRLVGMLTGFTRPLGECVDPAGDIFIVASATTSPSAPGVVYEYAHGGTDPIVTLSDPDRAYGCAVDPNSGNLAVVGGGIAIYKHASGKPVIHDGSDPFYFCGYDNKGNLYLSAPGQYLNQDQLFRLATGGSQVEQISLDVRLYNEDFSSPSSVQWDGNSMAASSAAVREPVLLYRLRISGHRATVVGTTTLSSRSNIFKSGQVWIQGGRVLGSAYFRGRGGVDSWSYPNATKPRTIVPRGVDPFGIAVSPGASK